MLSRYLDGVTRNFCDKLAFFILIWLTGDSTYFPARNLNIFVFFSKYNVLLSRFPPFCKQKYDDFFGDRDFKIIAQRLLKLNCCDQFLGR